MKVNEAPEKLYLIRNIPTPTALNITNDCHDKYLHEWYPERKTDLDVEYTRADAFIEKACEFIAENMKCDGYTLQTKAKFIKEFRKAMEE